MLAKLILLLNLLCLVNCAGNSIENESLGLWQLILIIFDLLIFGLNEFMILFIHKSDVNSKFFLNWRRFKIWNLKI